MIPGIVYSWSRTMPLDELEMYQFFAILSRGISVIFIFWGYFGNFIGFGGILVILRFQGCFGNFLGFGVFWSFLGFRGISVIF